MRLLHRHTTSTQLSGNDAAVDVDAVPVTLIIDAVSSMLETKDLGTVTLADIALRSGIAIEVLEQQFGDIGGVFATVLNDARERSRNLPRKRPTRSSEVGSYLLIEGHRLLAMPLSLATISSYAIDGGFGPTPSGAALQQIVIEEFELVWVEPLIDLGYPWIDIYAPLLSVLRKSFALVGAIDCGVKTVEDATVALDEALLAAVPVAA